MEKAKKNVSLQSFAKYVGVVSESLNGLSFFLLVFPGTRITEQGTQMGTWVVKETHRTARIFPSFTMNVGGLEHSSGPDGRDT